MKFLDKLITELLSKYDDLSNVSIVLPGKRPMVFIKKILMEKQYSAFLPQFYSIQDLIKEISGKHEISGVALWFFAYKIYQELHPQESIDEFLKWFPTLLKDWDDILKFSNDEKSVLDFMLDEERIKNWAENLSDNPNLPRNKYLDFWRKMNVFLPILKQKLSEENLATSGMIHEIAKSKIENFAKQTSQYWVFAGFNALTPVEKKLMKSLLQWDKADCFFQADNYYCNDAKQEAGAFIREHINWKEFNNNREFHWIENDFLQQKNIKVFEVFGNVSQTKVLPDILTEIPKKNWNNTAVVLLDENLLPASLETLSMVDSINITMGFPLKNLSFSNAIKQIFYLQKQLAKKESSYYYSDLLKIIDSLPKVEQEEEVIQKFKNYIEERNIIFVSKKILTEYLSSLTCFPLLVKPSTIEGFIALLIDFCVQLKFYDFDDVTYENISLFEQSFVVLNNQLLPYNYSISIEALELLVHQLIQLENIDFRGEPLNGLQVMGLLETRLLNFQNIIMLSVNEGKLPLGNTQNTFLPYDVRKEFGLQTFLENDSIYAYHFYRLIQDSKNVFLLYNSSSSGVNTGEKSRFITQLEIESPHELKSIVVENTSEPISNELVTIPKTNFVMEQLQIWKDKIAVSHLNSYIYNPIDFYMDKVLLAKESVEMEEELSIRNYGNLLHFSLEYIYKDQVGCSISKDFFDDLEHKINAGISFAIDKLKHQPEFYDKGINYIHKKLATKVLSQILLYDKMLIEEGNTLEIVALEYRFQEVEFFVNEQLTVSFQGYIDRIDRLNGNLRVLDYKTGKTKGLNLKIEEKNIETFFFNKERKQALQLCIYQFVVENLPQFHHEEITAGIWSFANVNNGPVEISFEKGSLEDAFVSIKNIILEILDPNIEFKEKEQDFYKK